MNKKAAAVAEAAVLPSTVFHAGESELLIIQRLFSPPFPVRVKRKKRGRKKTHKHTQSTSERAKEFQRSGGWFTASPRKRYRKAILHLYKWQGTEEEGMGMEEVYEVNQRGESRTTTTR